MSRSGRTKRCRQHKRKQAKLVKLSNSSPFNTLWQWMQKENRNPSLKHLRISSFKLTGRGVQTTKKLGKGHIVVQIPSKYLITASSVMNDLQVKNAVKNLGQKIKCSHLLTLFILYQKTMGNKSLWLPYLQSLPTTYSTLSYCTTDEVKLMPDIFQKKFAHYSDQVVSCYHTIEKLSKFLPTISPNFLSLDLIKWAFFTVNTRCIYLKSEDCPFLADESNMALAPLLDMLNHSYSSDVECRMNRETDSYEIITNKSFDKYDEVFINYGPHDNLKLCSDYGFMLPMNPHDSILVSLNELFVMARSPFWKKKTSSCFAKKEKILTEHFSKLSITSTGVCWNLETAITILLMDHEQIQNWKIVYQGIDGQPDLLKLFQHQLYQMKFLSHKRSLENLLKLSNPSEACQVVICILKEHCKFLQEISSME